MHARVEEESDRGRCISFGCAMQGTAVPIRNRGVCAVLKQVACDIDMASGSGKDDGRGTHETRLQVYLVHVEVKGLLKDLEVAEGGEHMQGVRADCFFGSEVLTAVAGDKAGHLTEVGAMRIRRHEVGDRFLYARIVGAGQCVESPMPCKIRKERVLIEPGGNAFPISARATGEALVRAVSVAVED